MVPLIVFAIVSFGLRARINARHIHTSFQLRCNDQLAVSGRLRAQTGRLYPAIHSDESQTFLASGKSEKMITPVKMHGHLDAIQQRTRAVFFREEDGSP